MAAATATVEGMAEEVEAGAEARAWATGWEMAEAGEVRAAALLEAATSSSSGAASRLAGEQAVGVVEAGA